MKTGPVREDEAGLFSTTLRRDDQLKSSGSNSAGMFW